MQSRSLDWEMARVARRQYGVVGREQLVEMGMGTRGIEHRIRTGRLHVLHPGVYAVGHLAVTEEARWLAAVMRGGGGSALSHDSAAMLWGIRRAGGSRQIEITTPRATRSHGAIRRHCAHLSPDETTRRRSIPVTTLARTLLDIAAPLAVGPMESAVREAEYLHGFRLRDLDALLDRYPGRRGIETLRTCRERIGHGPRGRVRSRLEARFATLLADTVLPMPELNAVLDLDGRVIEADCLWRTQRVIVELDGGKAHRTRFAFEADRERDRRLQGAGWRVVRITWRQLDQPAELLDDLRRLLLTAPY